MLRAQLRPSRLPYKNCIRTCGSNFPTFFNSGRNYRDGWTKYVFSKRKVWYTRTTYIRDPPTDLGSLIFSPSPFFWITWKGRKFIGHMRETLSSSDIVREKALSVVFHSAAHTFDWNRKRSDDAFLARPRGTVFTLAVSRSLQNHSPTFHIVFSFLDQWVFLAYGISVLWSLDNP